MKLKSLPKEFYRRTPFFWIDWEWEHWGTVVYFLLFAWAVYEIGTGLAR